MPWKISYLESQKIIRTEYTDPFMPEDFLKVIAENISIAKEKEYKSLPGRLYRLDSEVEMLLIFISLGTCFRQ